MKTVVITGATRGLGLEFARQYRADGWHVIGTARDPDAADALRATGADILPLDVGDPASISALGAAMAGRAIDLLINNAGVMGDPAGTALSADPVEWANVFAINTLGPALVTRALLPNLKLADTPIGVTLGSQAGILAKISGPVRAPYCASKAAAHAVTISLGHELAGQGVLYFALRPGWVRTDMTDGAGHLDPAESVAQMRSAIALAVPDWAGLFIDRTGRIYPFVDTFKD
ncbi:SDR family oxidoreductase [Oceaniglobus ichthyenteri]|uniref:SDR family oxidoreductase n=1 Tax=Oceaniglobus ichthyenteri TaxID=2136177 RepID=UPI000D3D0368|nr:SDR family oxidoreductase [Oceaniglobus ichthyenteri]